MAAHLLRKFPSSFTVLASSRQLTVGAVLSAKPQPTEDPIKQLFLQKIKEYRDKSKSGKLPDVTPEEEKRLSDEIKRIKGIYGDEDVSKFPTFEFKDPPAPELPPLDSSESPPQQ